MAINMNTLTFREHRCSNGEILLYTGEPDVSLFEEITTGPGDVWHSSLDQGYRDAFPDVVYYATAHWWYVHDYADVNRCVSWRVSCSHMVIRKKVWDATGGLDMRYESAVMRDVDFGYRVLWYCRAVPMYYRGLFSPEVALDARYNDWERYLFYFKHFKREHTAFMCVRKILSGTSPVMELRAIREARQRNLPPVQTPVAICVMSPSGDMTNRKVSVVLPTMRRQAFARALLEDYAAQSLKPDEVFVIDQTPVEERDPVAYSDLPVGLNVIIHWLETPGSCAARNVALAQVSGDYVIFADDDTRILPDFVYNHVAFLETTKADACNGPIVRADHPKQTPEDLRDKLKGMTPGQSFVGVSGTFSNGNACVRATWLKVVHGNDMNYEGGYGEDSDYGHALARRGAVVLLNPFAAILHLKPPTGGYRWWGLQRNHRGRGSQPSWAKGQKAGFISPRPSPTIVYGVLKNYSEQAIREWEWKYLLMSVMTGPKHGVFQRLLVLPYRMLQLRKAKFFARMLTQRGAIGG